MMVHKTTVFVLKMVLREKLVQPQEMDKLLQSLLNVDKMAKALLTISQHQVEIQYFTVKDGKKMVDGHVPKIKVENITSHLQELDAIQMLLQLQRVTVSVLQFMMINDKMVNTTKVSIKY